MNLLLIQLLVPSFNAVWLRVLLRLCNVPSSSRRRRSPKTTTVLVHNEDVSGDYSLRCKDSVIYSLKRAVCSLRCKNSVIYSVKRAVCSLRCKDSVIYSVKRAVLREGEDLPKQPLC